MMTPKTKIHWTSSLLSAVRDGVDLRARCRSSAVGFRSLGLVLLAIVVVGTSSAVAQDRKRLGVLDAGQVVRLPISTETVFENLSVEIDGVMFDGQIGRAGTTVLISVPDNLSGIYHQIVLFTGEHPNRHILGVWDFETQTGEWAKSATLSTEVGQRAGEGRHEGYGLGSGRLSFNNDDGRTRGALGFSIPEGARDAGDITLDTWYLERRMTVAGQDAYLRFGDQSFDAPSRLIGSTVRRGASFRLAAPSGAHDTAVFAVQASGARDPQSLFGMTRDDYLFGALSNIKPFKDHGLTFGLTGFDGHSPQVADGMPGQVSGAGLAVLAPLSDHIDLAAQVDRSVAGGETGLYRAVSGDFSLLPDVTDRLLILSLGYEAMDQYFFTPLTTNDEQGQERVRVSLERLSQDWMWLLEGSVATTNYNGSSDVPVDRLAKVTFDASFVPTSSSGLWEGAALSFGASYMEQRRQITPASAFGPQDHDIWTAYIGYDRLSDFDSFAVQYSFDWFQDRVDGATSEKIHKIETYYNRILSPRSDAHLSLKVEHTSTPSTSYLSAQGLAEISFDLVPDEWTLRAIGEISAFEDPSKEDGAAFGAALEWEVFDDHTLVLQADYGRGASRPDFLTQDGWQIGLALRSDFSLF
ncbi:hypothetical protein [Celeribacter sp.]|uniref:hypothetical protein n=1 Tax=Celeribacter sp. TaxID=1890673 RepID=UPI003A91E5F6